MYSLDFVLLLFRRALCSFRKPNGLAALQNCSDM